MGKVFAAFTALCLLLGASVSVSAAAESYQELTKDSKKTSGLFTVYTDEKTGSVLLELEDFEQPFIMYSSLPFGLGSNDIGLDRGQVGESRVAQFELRGGKVLLTQLNTYYRANSDNPAERRAVEEAFADSVLFGFPIKARSGNKVLIDFAPLLMTDLHGVASRIEATGQGSVSLDTSRSAIYLENTRNFVDNSEFEAVVTFTGNKPGEYLRQVAPQPQHFTVHQHLSLVRLPDDDYQTRQFHPYSGFWSIAHADYASAIDEPLIKRVIPRHRLKKKDPTAAVSEAVEPIIYYLDPGVPEPVRTALLDGARWWNQAFDAIGYKDAFQVKILPEGADPMDARYNVIQWVHRATRGWSYGASIIDPRTGEIIKGHVTLGSLRVRQDLLIAKVLSAPYDAENPDLEPLKQMALNRIRQLSAHEVGHTLGIAHNFAASSSDRASVMDYPHPLVSLTDDGQLNVADAYDKGMGDWDKYTVAYGYSDFASQAEEREALAKLVADVQASGLKYLSDPDSRSVSSANPLGHLWDNGSDPVAELRRLIELRGKALTRFGTGVIADGEPLSDLEEALVPLYLLHRYQAEAAGKLIGGVHYSYDIKGEANNTEVAAVAAERQEQALSALLETLHPEFLTLPDSILKQIPPKAYGHFRTRESFPGQNGVVLDPLAVAESAANHSLTVLLNPQRLNRVAVQHAKDSELLSVVELLDETLQATLLANPVAGLEAAVQQRTGARVVQAMTTLLGDGSVSEEVRASTYSTMLRLQSQLDRKARKSSNAGGYKAFYQWQLKRLQDALNRSEPWPAPEQQKTPPGSPIG